MAKKRSDVERYERYQRVVAVLMAEAEFYLAEVKQRCAEKPAFVTRIAGELEKDGCFERFGPKTKPQFRWVTDRDVFDAAAWINSRIYGTQLTRSPRDDRPRERLLAQGSDNLKTAELLAILIRSGQPGESALQAGEKIASHYAEQLDRLAHAGRGELRSITPAVGEMAYCQIMAGIELGRRVAAAGNRESQNIGAIRNPDQARAYCQRQTVLARLAEDGAREEFHIVTLDTKNRAINTHQISIGLLDQTVVHPREVFRPAIKDAAKAVILVHNHPSGDPTPSDTDLSLTRRLEEAGKTVGIQIVDHIIVARNGAISIREHQASGGRKFPDDVSSPKK